MTDERLGKNTKTTRDLGDENREDRATESRAATGDRKLSDEERIKMFQRQFYQDALPDLPTIPGYHVCWLTTSNPRDTVHQRMRLGYEPIKSVDIPGWDYVSIKTGEYAGFIGVNEMLAFKLPIALYEAFMKEAHHDEPRRQEEGIMANVDKIRESARAKGGDVVEEEGNQELRKGRPAPRFASPEELQT